MNIAVENHLTAILFSKEDALRFKKERPDSKQIFPLTPDARVVLQDINLPLLSSIDFYTDYAHARVLARVRRMEKTFLEELKKESRISIAAKETLRGEIHVIACIAANVWEILKKNAPCILPDALGWKTYSKPEEAHEHLLGYLLQKRKSYFVMGVPPLGKMINYLNSIIARLVKRNSIVMVSDYSYGLSHLANEMSTETSLVTYSLSGTRGSWKDYFYTLKSFFDVLKCTKNRILFVAPQEKPKTEMAVNSVLSTITDPVIRRSITLFSDYLKKKIALLDSLHSEFESFMRIVEPKKIIASQFRWQGSAVLGEVAQWLGIPTLLISHGSHTIQSSATSNFEQRENAQGLIVSPFADEILLQSPHAEKYFLSVKSRSRGKKSRPVMWAYNRYEKKAKKDNFRYILHAGSCKTYTTTRPWMYETSDEFVAGLYSLVLATKDIKNTKLIIRVRPNDECSVETLTKLLPQMDHYTIKTSGKFLEDLALADMLVSFSSTTIEEALQYGCPVLLWGGTMRYRHLPARMEYPTRLDRGCVYAPKTKSDLPSMINAVLDAHDQAPLSETELAEHVWSKKIPWKTELIQQFRV